MKKNPAVGLMMFVVMFVLSGDLYAFDDTAKKLFNDGQYDECIQRIESVQNAKKDVSNIMLLAFSNYQLYQFTKQKHYNNEYKAQYDLLLAKSGVDDLNSILFFVNSNDKPEVVKTARKLLKDIFATLHKIEDTVKLVPFASSNDKAVREYAFDSIKRIMKPIREIVKDGGTMRPIDLRYFQNKDVINTAIENITISAAQDILILIEEPAIAFLNNSKSSGSIKVNEKITREMGSRKKKYPDSSWYSATGKQIQTPN